MKKHPARHMVRFANLDRVIAAFEGETLLQSARRAGVRIAGACGGRGVCGSCHVRILSGQTGIHPGQQEQPENGTTWIRACQVEPLSDLVVEVSPRARAAQVRADVQCLGDDQEITGFVPGRRGALGFAIDLGTTNMAGSLTDLESGKRLVSLGIENPQSAYGADLISRLSHAIRTPDGARELQSIVIQGIESLAELLCAEIAVVPTNIIEIALCGNTAMHHLLLGLPVFRLGRAPFIPDTCSAIDTTARDLGLDSMPGASVHLLPNIGGFVGGDHVAALLATEHLWNTGTSMVIDIGTNTELSLIHNGTISTASTASGPALEGGNISCGMRAAEGAIEKVWLSEGEIITRVIGGGSPLGICGSGVLDALNALRQAGIINRRGYISPGSPTVAETGGIRKYSFAPDVVMTQSDVRAVMLAKAAIRAGQDMLLADAGLTEQAMQRILIAGAFGAYIDISSAINIGLFPDLPLERFTQVGNAAGTGVRMALISPAMRGKAAGLAKRCRHLELNSMAGFQKAFIGRIHL
ncbi:MAG TPA: DUF4445 domain-containing protein [Desulfuromonadales bacterium]|nr:DUF4445 domain-containing protein [Desulfuromonadales bacterium]